MVHHLHKKCFEMKIGQKLACDDCGLELTVVKECDQHCKEKGCCETNDFYCCGKPMALVE
jgi:hypothetical protein